MNIVQISNDVLYVINVINTVVQFILFFTLFVAALYVFSGKYVKMLITILEPLGFKKAYIPKVLFHCRFGAMSNATYNVRIFCEYMILKSQGIYKDKKWWRKEYDSFKSFFNKDKPYDHVLKIDNLSELSCDEELEEATIRYFIYLHENRNKHGLEEDQCNSFLLLINIKYGLLTTNFLISGLLKTYKDDWNVLINKYITTINNEKKLDDLYTSEISYTFVWLLWGPSYQLVEEQTGNYKIAQYSFGDESNSFVVIIPEAEKSMENSDLWEKIRSSTNGIVCELTCKLFLANEYMERKREYFSSRSSYYIEKIRYNNAFILEKYDTKEQKGKNAMHYYCTSYVWIIFYSEKDGDSSFNPNKTVAFFEHANQADKSSYEQCVKALLAKTFAFFDEVFKENKYRRKYHYLLSMNQDIEIKFANIWYEKTTLSGSMLSENYSKYLNIYDSKYKPEDIFQILDSYFSDTGGRLNIIEVNYNDKDSLAYWGEYYTVIHIHESKIRKEGNSLDDMINYLKNKEENKPPLYHVVLSKEDGVIAGVICDYKPKTNCLLLKSIHIKEEYQSKSADIQEEIIKYLKIHLQKKGYGFYDILRNIDLT